MNVWCVLLLWIVLTNASIPLSCLSSPSNFGSPQAWVYTSTDAYGWMDQDFET